MDDREINRIGAQIAGASQSRDYEKSSAMTACREMTIAEHLDRQIKHAEETAHNLRDLKGNLSQNFLNSGMSRLAAILLNTK